MFENVQPPNVRSHQFKCFDCYYLAFLIWKCISIFMEWKHTKLFIIINPRIHQNLLDFMNNLLIQEETLIENVKLIPYIKTEYDTYRNRQTFFLTEKPDIYNRIAFVSVTEFCLFSCVYYPANIWYVLVLFKFCLKVSQICSQLNPINTPQIDQTLARMWHISFREE